MISSLKCFFFRIASSFELVVVFTILHLFFIVFIYILCALVLHITQLAYCLLLVFFCYCCYLVVLHVTLPSFVRAFVDFLYRYALIFSMDNVFIHLIHVHMHILQHIVHLMLMVLLLFVLIMLKENVLEKHANIFIHLIILLHN